MHHVDVHVASVAPARALLDAVMPLVGFDLRHADDESLSYWKNGRRPSIWFSEDAEHGSGAMRLAFGVANAPEVDAAAAAAASNGARCIEGPGIHPEYGDDYYAVFFEDADGNKFEIVRDPEYAQ
jgi:catechol 2,3-dioxygenase-like lactoylglutathione lyase family enzyme